MAKVHTWTNATRKGFLNSEFDALWAAIVALQSGSSASYVSVSATAHGFAAGDFLGHDGSSWVKASASLTGTAALVRVVAVTDANTFTIAGPGLHSISNSDSQGSHWLSTTAGATQTSPPFGHKIQLVQVVISSTLIVILPPEAIA